MIKRNKSFFYRKKNKKLTFNLVKVCFIFSFVLFVGCVFGAIQSTLIFSKISSLEREEKRLIQEKSYLEEKLFKVDSLNNAVFLSKEKGFTSDVSFVYLSDGKPVAKLP